MGSRVYETGKDDATLTTQIAGVKKGCDRPVAAEEKPPRSNLMTTPHMYAILKCL